MDAPHGAEPLGMNPRRRALVIRTLLIDQLTAEITGVFAAEGIETLVLKGPVLAAWLYPGDLRAYGDSDLMVAPGDWDRAVAILQRLGFSDHLGPLAHPRMESFASTAFLRGEDNLDLHCALHGLNGDLQGVWQAFSANAQHQTIGGAEVRVPSRQALLLHVGLHAAHHAETKALEDLERALAIASEAEWLQALELARTCDGVLAFASGLMLVPAGAELARRLRIDDVRSLHHALRFEGIPTAEALGALLAPGVSWRERLATVRTELAPRPEFMRWRFALARRGRLGLVASYPWRWAWLLIQVPRGLLAVRRARAKQSR
ncbi:MAG TPA: nucleotidyltransferase family protein [Solirubrobacteraceae bacterium]|nr:nucleotidyltransferase family protein [Solirubrobacteraceae bacterium]